MVRKISDKEKREWLKAAKEVGVTEPISRFPKNIENRKMISGEFVEKYCK